MRRLLCILLKHRQAAFSGRKFGRHLAGSYCIRCGRVLTLRAGSRQERRRIQRQRASA